MNGALFKLIISTVIVIGAAFLACFFLLNELPGYKYTLNTPDSGTALSVTLEITNPFFSKTNTVTLYIGDKQITVNGCKDAQGRPAGDPYTNGGLMFITIGRGSKTFISYTAGIAAPGKHGSQGIITGDYAVFDGEEALLLPYDYYNYKPGSDRAPLMGGISFDFNLPAGWERITRRPAVKNPRWADIYGIAQDAFVFGKFTKIPGTARGLSAFALSSVPDPVSQETVDGFNSLYAYYAKLFGSAPDLYSVIALPKADARTPQVIGGAGRGSVAASFDPDLLRDWQLLAHRMFHAFFDTAAPYAAIHMAPNTWFNEGLAAYYENMSMDALPSRLKQRLDISVNGQFALLFDRFLYMRIKDPMVFNYPPMKEDQMPSQGNIEFLHYTYAPLIVKLLDDQARDKGGPPDAALKFCVSHGASFDDRFVAFETALNLLGQDDGQKFCETYLMNPQIPPLWYLKPYQPPDKEVLGELNDFEYVLGTWFKQDDANYHTDNISYEQLTEAEANLDKERASFVSAGMGGAIENYCAPVYALLNDYFYRAKQKGINYNDPDLRKKMFAESGAS